ncbi:MAG: hypothetical protein OXQ29_13510 [Rhodospirillaceae bacterium]|nr:hypothetical protein [Rhodospirillaceae bacterium]
MAATAFDTLDAARRLKAAGIEAEHAEAIVEIMGQSVNQLVTHEHFSTELRLFREHVDAEIAKLRAEIMRTHLISVGVLIAAIALATTILGMMMTRGGGI